MITYFHGSTMCKGKIKNKETSENISCKSYLYDTNDSQDKTMDGLNNLMNFPNYDKQNNYTLDQIYWLDTATQRV